MLANIELDEDNDLQHSDSSSAKITKFDEAYEQMMEGKKWTLSTGKIVEDELHKFGKRCKFEQ